MPDLGKNDHKDLTGYKKDQYIPLTPKEFFDDRKNRRLFVLCVLVIITSVVFAGIGMFMLYVSLTSKAETRIDVLGLFSISTESVSIGLLGVGAAVFLGGLRILMTRW